MKEKIRVLHVNKLYFPWIGGVETICQQMSEYLANHPEFDVTVLACHEKDQWFKGNLNRVSVIKVPNLIYRLFKKTLFLSSPYSRHFRKQLKAIPADILHFHLPNPLAVISCFLVRPKGRLLITYHSDIIKQKWILLFYRPFLKWFLNRADRILVTSPNLLMNSPVLKSYEAKCQVHPLGLNLAEYALTESQEVLLDVAREKRQRPLLLYVGRLVYYKGVHVLVEAMKDLDADLIMIGSGNLEQNVRNQIYRLGLEDRISISPPVAFRDLVYYFHLADIFILPSVANSEAFGIVQLEAMLCQTAVVSTNLPTGVPWVNKDGFSGLTVPPSDSRALHDALHRLISDPVLRNKLARQGLQRVRKEFDNQKLMTRLIEHYQELML